LKEKEQPLTYISFAQRITVAKVKDLYRAHYDDETMELTFGFEKEIADDSTILADLNRHNDCIVVFTTQGLGGQGKALSDPVADTPSSFLLSSHGIDTEDVAMGNGMDLTSDDFLMEDQKIEMARGDTTSVDISMADAASPGGAPFTTREEDSKRQHSFQFEDDEMTGTGTGTHTTTKQSALRQLLEETSPEKLEAAVQQGTDVLEEIEGTLNTIRKDPDARKWLEQIDEVRMLAKRNRTVVGVVGNTGAGKSSVINAVLDEERLVPTNCMRACTAVVTEISYNDSIDEDGKYRAEVEFVRPEDWRKELTILFDEVFDKVYGMSKEANNPDTIAGVAWAKIRAVYSQHTKEMLQKSTVKQLMEVPNVKSILGTTKRIRSGDCESFYRELQHYVDSQQKGGSTGRSKREQEFWPLIKVVRIYTKADALSTGAVIVDLPGVHDSNAARAAVADGYMKECTGLWIVAPITRAIDDKAAKNLLGNSFKRQLKYDGTYSAVTFICSKTDDISRTEAAEALGLGTQLAKMEEERNVILQKKHAAVDERQRFRAELDAQEPAIAEYEEQIEYWEGLIKKLENGGSVDEPISPKRKRSYSPDAGDDEELDDQPMTAEQAYSKIEERKMHKKDARRYGQKLRERRQQLQEQINNLEAREVELDQRADAMCIKGRNDWSRKHIREDFADGIKELDQENAAEKDPKNFDPSEDIRDYDEVARSLPVFCVSARAYQKLCGRLQKDGRVGGFASKQETEIPQLQDHCHKLTESGREAGCKNFLNGVSQMLSSLALWTSDDGGGLQMSTQQRMSVRTYITASLQKLGEDLQSAVNQTVDDAVVALSEQLIDYFEDASNTAATSAVPTAIGWGAPRDDGGLFWATYKATVRRHGVFQGASGSRNFNVELTDPLYRELGTPWEKTFQRGLPAVFQRLPQRTSVILKDFHLGIEESCKAQNLGVLRINRLRDNVPVYESAFKNLANSMVININEAQREVNREFTPAIASAMGKAYEFCSLENGRSFPLLWLFLLEPLLTQDAGRGSYARMKEHMNAHVSETHMTMFENATSEVRDKLAIMCDQVRRTMSGRVERMFQEISRDYMTIVGSEQGRDRGMGRSEKFARKMVENAITQSEVAFSEVLG
jgi:hypothetical protein